MITKSVAMIFLNDDRSFFTQKAEIAIRLLKYKLNFEDVQYYEYISKSEIIEKMDLLQVEIEDFERLRGPNEKMAIAIVNIGYAYENEDLDQEVRRFHSLKRFDGPGTIYD